MSALDVLQPYIDWFKSRGHTGGPALEYTLVSNQQDPPPGDRGSGPNIVSYAKGRLQFSEKTIGRFSQYTVSSFDGDSNGAQLFDIRRWNAPGGNPTDPFGTGLSGPFDPLRSEKIDLDITSFMGAVFVNIRLLSRGNAQITFQPEGNVAAGVLFGVGEAAEASVPKAMYVISFQRLSVTG